MIDHEDLKKTMTFVIEKENKGCKIFQKKTSHGMYISQILRYHVVCMDYTDFIKRVITLSDKFVRQHYEKSNLKYTFIKT